MQEKNIETLVINKVENQEVYDAMVAANKINSNELYLVGGGEQVTGVKGDKETAFRTGDVNLTASNIGALAEDTPVIKYTEQTLDNDQKIQARTNIGAGVPTSFTEDGNGNIVVNNADEQTAKQFLQSLTFSGLNYKYINPFHSATYGNPYGAYIKSGTTIIDYVVNTITEPGVYTAYVNRAVEDIPEAAKTLNSSLRGFISVSQLNKSSTVKCYAFILLMDEASNFYVQYIKGNVGSGWKQMQDKISATGLLKNDGDGNITAAVAGVDYVEKVEVATIDASGLMSAADKVKLNAIEEGANKTTVDDALSSTSTNPVQNKVINTKLTTMQTDIDSKVDKDGNKVLSTNDFTTALKNNLNSAYTHSTSAHAPSNAERNTIVTIKRNGTALTPTDRVVDITVPTKTSDLTNDSDFATNSSVDTKLANKVTVVSGKGLSTEDYTSAEKTKLSGIATGAEVNQNAFSNVVVGKTTVAADSKTDTLTLISGSNVTLTPDATNDTITIAATDTVYTHPSVTRSNATSTASPAHGKTFTAIDSITTNGTGHVTAVNTKTVTLPADSDTLGKNIVGTATTSKANGAVTGNGVYLNHIEGTGTVKSAHKITGAGATKVTSDANGNITITSTDSDTVYTHPTYTRSNTTSTGSPAHGGTFTAIDGITTNNLGHVTAVNTKTVTLPAAPVTSVNSKTGAVSLTASDVDALPISGGTLTGNLTGKYITGTWLQTTAATDKAGRIATIDNDGWIYYRTLAETKGDLGISDNLVKYDSNTTVEATTKVNADTLEGHATSYFVPKSGGTMTGALVAQTNTNYTTAQMRNVIISTADPSGGNNGDIWLKYEA